MSGFAALFRHSLRRRRGFLTAIFVVVVLFQIFMIIAARDLELSGGFRQIEALMPAFMKQWSNMMAASFSGFVLFGYSHPVVQLCLIAMVVSIGTELAQEIETRFVDVLLSRPVPRAAAINRSIALMTLATGLAVGAMMTATWAGLAMLAPPTAKLPAPRVVLSLGANLALLVLAWGAIALAVSSMARRRGPTTAIMGLAAFAAFILDYVGRFWAPAADVSRLSLFHYFSPFTIMGGGSLRLLDAVVLSSVIIVSVIVAQVVYRRRDL